MRIIPGIMGAAGAAASAGGGDYAALATHFPDETWLGIASLTSTDNAYFSVSLWVKWNSLDFNAGGMLFCADPDNNYAPQASIDFDGTVGEIEFQSYTPESSDSYTVATTTNPVIADAWHHVLFTQDTNHAQPDKVGKLWINDVDVTADTPTSGDAFLGLFNGLSFYFAGDSYAGDNTIADFADVWIAPGVSLLTSGNISEATRRKFISAEGKPVSLGANGELPTGTAPAIFFTGNATTFGTNAGTGGAFTLTGGPLTNAATSPSD